MIKLLHKSLSDYGLGIWGFEFRALVLNLSFSKATIILDHFQKLGSKWGIPVLKNLIYTKDLHLI